MEKHLKNNSGNEEGITQSDSESKKSGSPAETEEKKAIVFNTIKEPMQSYFSSPCMLQEIEDDEDFLNR
jgi:hypothetical protein